MVSADAAALDEFRNWVGFWDVTISEIESGTTYGIIAGSSAPDSPGNTCGFILIPRPVQP